MSKTTEHQDSIAPGAQVEVPETFEKHIAGAERVSAWRVTERHGNIAWVEPVDGAIADGFTPVQMDVGALSLDEDAQEASD